MTTPAPLPDQGPTPTGDVRRVFGTTAVIVAVVGLLVVGTWFLLNWDYVEFRIFCHEYRNGSCWYSKDRPAGPLQLITWNSYFKKHHQGMSESEVIRLLGAPRVEKGESADGFVDVQAWLEHLGIEPDGSEHVLVYNEYGPPEHFIGDESENIFILVRDKKVVAYDGLFP